jgi:hypothetical protein
VFHSRFLAIPSFRRASSPPPATQTLSSSCFSDYLQGTRRAWVPPWGRVGLRQRTGRAMACREISPTGRADFSAFCLTLGRRRRAAFPLRPAHSARRGSICDAASPKWALCPRASLGRRLRRAEQAEQAGALARLGMRCVCAFASPRHPALNPPPPGPHSPQHASFCYVCPPGVRRSRTGPARCVQNEGEI